MNQVMISADSTCDLPVDLQRQRHVYCFALSILLVHLVFELLLQFY